jgi:hypothetical protein
MTSLTWILFTGKVSNSGYPTDRPKLEVTWTGSRWVRNDECITGYQIRHYREIVILSSQMFKCTDYLITAQLNSFIRTYDTL